MTGKFKVGELVRFRDETIATLDHNINVIRQSINMIAEEAQEHADMVLKWAVQSATRAIDSPSMLKLEGPAETATELEEAADAMVKYLRAIAAGKGKIETLESIKSVLVKAPASDAESEIEDD